MYKRQDKQSQMGRKILVTGNGKCNLTNFAQKEEYYRSDCPGRAQKVLSVFGQREAMELFQSLGIYTKDKNGYVYPYSEQAASVREAFEAGVLSGTGVKMCIRDSPTPDQIYEGIKAVDDGKGVLMVVKNYTGDVLNFEMAAEMAADMDGIDVKEVVVNDDVAVQDSLYTTGRRGVAGTVFVQDVYKRQGLNSPTDK